MAWQDRCEGWGGPSSIEPLALARLVIRHFPEGVVPSTGIDIRETAYAVASAESGKNPMACGDRAIGGSVGLWQVYTVAHPSYDPERLFEQEYNAQAALAISGGGQHWCPWSVFEVDCGPGHTGSYRRYLDEGAVYLALAGHQVIILPPGGPVVGVGVSLMPLLGMGLVAAGLYGFSRLR